MNARKNVLIVDNAIAITGALKSIILVSSHLKGEFNFIYVLPANSSAIDLIEKSGFKYFKLPFVEITKQPKNLLLYLPYLIYNSIKLKSIIKANEIEIVHMNDFFNMTGVGAKILGTSFKLVTHVRLLPQRFFPALSKIWTDLNLKYASHIVCNSQAVRSYFPSNETKVTVVYNVVPVAEKLPPKVVSEIGADVVQLFYLGNFIRGKGQDHALKAFAKAYSVDSRLRLLFAGGDMGLKKNKEFRSELEYQVKEMGLDHVVQFASFIQDIETQIKKADIMLNFSESESFSLTCLEALFYGTPLIASNCGGPAELFENGKSGILVANKDVNAMADAIISLAANASMRTTFSQEGKKFVRLKFNKEYSLRKLQQIYLS